MTGFVQQNLLFCLSRKNAVGHTVEAKSVNIIQKIRYAEEGNQEGE